MPAQLYVPAIGGWVAALVGSTFINADDASAVVSQVPGVPGGLVLMLRPV